MEIIYSEKAIEDLSSWKKSGDKVSQKKISDLLRDIKEHPYTGKGKPEALKYNLLGLWSRRINQGDRLIYSIEKGETLIVVHSLKGHYD